MRALIVEDSARKQQEVKQLLDNMNCVTDVVFCEMDAKEKLEDKQYDVLVLDILIPGTSGGISDLQYGRNIINLIYKSKAGVDYHRPSMVVVLSEYLRDKEKGYEALAEELMSYPVCLIHYDHSGEWKTIFKERLEHLISRLCDIAIITAVDNEFDMVYAWGCWNEGNKVPDFTYKETKLKDSRGNELSVILLKQKEMGMVCATALTSKIISIFNPHCIIMCGICAGRKGAAKCGDIVISNKALDYGSGSITEENKKKISFEPAPNYIDMYLKKTNFFNGYKEKVLPLIKCSIQTGTNLNERIIKAVKNFSDVAEELRNEENKVEIGIMATGAAVIKSEKFTNIFIRSQHRKYSGIDMETYGVYYAVKNSGSDAQFFSIKSVVDVADNNKGDKYQKYCSLLASLIVRHFIENDYSF